MAKSKTKNKIQNTKNELERLWVIIKQEPTEINIHKLLDTVRDYRRTLSGHDLATAIVKNVLAELKVTFDPTKNLSQLDIQPLIFMDTLSELEFEYWNIDIEDLEYNLRQFIRSDYNLETIVDYMAKLLTHLFEEN